MTNNPKAVKLRAFVQPMDWATEHQLYVMREELSQEVTGVYLSCRKEAGERNGLRAVELEIGKRGL